MLSIVKSLLSPLLCSNCETTLCSHPETATTRWDQPPSFNLKITPNVLALISYRQQYIACLNKIFERHIFCKFLSFFNILYFSMEYLLDQISTHIVFWSKQHWLSICGHINIIYSSIEYLSVNIEYWGKHSTDCQYLEMHQKQIDRKWFHLHAAQTGGK